MCSNPSYVLTAHAIRVIQERGIALTWVERILAKPMKIELDRHDPTLRHALGGIREFGDRVLRVVYNETTQPQQVVTAYFDRTQRGKL